MLSCTYCGSDDLTFVWDDGYEVSCICNRCEREAPLREREAPLREREFETQRNYPPYLIDDMEIKTITYKRTKGLPGYSSESLEMHAELDYDEDPLIAASELQDTVLIALGLKEAKPKDIETLPLPSEGESNATKSDDPDDSDDLDNTPF